MSEENAVSPIRRWLIEAAERCASDLHLVAGYPPIRREHGEMVQMDLPPLDAVAVRTALVSNLLRRRLCPLRARAKLGLRT